MSNVVVWGTSISAIGSSQRRRDTSAGDLRVTDSGEIRVAFLAPSQVEFLRITGAGDHPVLWHIPQGVLRVELFQHQPG
jgi:hypothetical protein